RLYPVLHHPSRLPTHPPPPHPYTPSYTTLFRSSITPIWTIDDLAPSPSRRAAESQETAITDIIRSTFNASPKMRMTREMGTRKAAKPAAQLIITAENELSVPSAAQRSIGLRIGRGSLNPSSRVTNAIFDAAATGLQSRVTQHAVLGLHY